MIKQITSVTTNKDNRLHIKFIKADGGKGELKDKPNLRGTWSTKFSSRGRIVRVTRAMLVLDNRSTYGPSLVWKGLTRSKNNKGFLNLELSENGDDINGRVEPLMKQLFARPCKFVFLPAAPTTEIKLKTTTTSPPGRIFTTGARTQAQIQADLQRELDRVRAQWGGPPINPDIQQVNEAYDEINNELDPLDIEDEDYIEEDEEDDE